MEVAQQPTRSHFYLAQICDIRGIVFSFIGVNKDLANFRLISKDWKKFVDEYMIQVYRMKRHDIQLLRPIWEEMHQSMSPQNRDIIEMADVRKTVYENFNRNTFLRSIKLLAKINHPSKSTKEGVLAAMHLLVDEEELSKSGDALDWKYFRKKLFNRNFVKALKDIKPEDLTPGRMAKFEAALGMETITEYDQMYASAEARNVYMWAVNIVEYKQFLDTLTEEMHGIIRQCKIQKSIETEFEHFENILRTTKCVL